MEREKTNSITELVKIVAREEIEKYVGNGLEGVLKDICLTSISSLTSALRKAGEHWTPYEDNLLSTEVQVALAQIAKSHDRTVGAIIARIKHKELLGK